MGGGWSPWAAQGRYRSRPRRVARGGIRARSRRGTIGTTWWGRRWIEALEGFGWANRIERGRSYARQGQVVRFRIVPGAVEAKVQGSRPVPYTVRIAVRPISERKWRMVARALVRRSSLGASLLAGEMPEGIEETFRTANAALFPESDDDFQTDCSCPDWANPCKHVAAVHFLVGEALDRDPFLLFTLRGRSKEELLRDLRAERTQTLPGRTTPKEPPAPPSSQPPVAMEVPSRPASFWSRELPASFPAVAIAPPAIPRAPLVRLGDPPFLRGNPAALAALEATYDRLSARALSVALGGGARVAAPGSDASRPVLPPATEARAGGPDRLGVPDRRGRQRPPRTTAGF